MNCPIPKYIQKANLSQSEQERLAEININIFQDAVDSKAFRVYNSKLYTLKNNIQAAYSFVSSINAKYKAKVASIQTSQPGQHFLSVNVLPISKELQGVLFANVEDSDEVNYQLKVVALITKNIDKIKQWEKQVQTPPVFWEKLQKDLGIPKEQVTLLKETEGSNIEEKLVNFIANYSYTIEVNTAKENKVNPIGDINKQEWDKRVQELANQGLSIEERRSILEKEFNISSIPTQHYSNLTVPGGTNYTENEIVTPLITPNIKGHAQFSTDNGIGWFRSDDKTGGLEHTYTKEELEDFLPERFNVGEEQIRYVPSENKWYSDTTRKFLSDEQVTSKYLQTLPQKEATKTRRILEVQSDLFQKGRDSDFLLNSLKERLFETDTQKLGKKLPANQFLQLLNKDNNWVTFFIKSIIQDSAKQTVTGVQESDVEAKVRELEKEGLLEIDCKGLKAEKGLQTNFTKGGKWKVYEIFEGKSHKQGGIDINIKNNQISFTNKNGSIKAKYGLVVPKDN